jgi:micrococcal nuclease
MKKVPLLLFLLLVLVNAFFTETEDVLETGPEPLKTKKKSESKAPINVVNFVYDGDTVNYTDSSSGKKVKRKARLIGIDTPESPHSKKKVGKLWKEATEFTKKWVSEHDEYVEVINKKDDDDGLDKYKRQLIWLRDKKEVLNVELVKAGLAEVKFYGNNYLKYAKDLLKAEKAAKKAKRGIWRVKK